MVKPRVYAIIPAFNEEKSIGLVVREIPVPPVEEVIVVNNGSTDRTAVEATSAGASVLDEPRMGYGQACLTGIAYVREKAEKEDIIVFLDGDHSDYPEELPLLIEPILQGEADMVIGSRALGEREKGSMTPQQIFGNKLATYLLRKLYGGQYTDLGPFRAIRFEALEKLNMVDRTYGWTVEMQLKAIRCGLTYREIPVRYRNRIGFSKVSGTLKGTVMAGYKIIWTLLKYR
jgi:glycosyltransferase involved in cell wall biosynthesis